MQESTNLNWLQTYTGKKFYFNQLNTSDDICIEDIAHSLAMTCRFGGHCRVFYSVGQHCITGVYYAPDDLAIHMLLHDAAEAYYCDIPRGLKNSTFFNFNDMKTAQAYVNFERYEYIELEMLERIYLALGVELPTDKQLEQIKVIDNRLLATEARDLFNKLPDWDIDDIEPFSDSIRPLPWMLVERMYLDVWSELYDS